MNNKKKITEVLGIGFLSAIMTIMIAVASASSTGGGQGGTIDVTIDQDPYVLGTEQTIWVELKNTPYDPANIPITATISYPVGTGKDVSGYTDSDGVAELSFSVLQNETPGEFTVRISSQGQHLTTESFEGVSYATGDNE